jgi:hypothetical protein
MTTSRNRSRNSTSLPCIATCDPTQDPGTSFRAVPTEPVPTIASVTRDDAKYPSVSVACGLTGESPFWGENQISPRSTSSTTSVWLPLENTRTGNVLDHSPAMSRRSVPSSPSPVMSRNSIPSPARTFSTSSWVSDQPLSHRGPPLTPSRESRRSGRNHDVVTASASLSPLPAQSHGTPGSRPAREHDRPRTLDLHPDLAVIKVQESGLEEEGDSFLGSTHCGC